MNENKVKEKLSAVLKDCPYVFQLGCLRAILAELDDKQKENVQLQALYMACENEFQKISAKIDGLCNKKKPPLPRYIFDHGVEQVSNNCERSSVFSTPSNTDDFLRAIEICKTRFSRTMPEWESVEYHGIFGACEFSLDIFKKIYSNYREHQYPSDFYFIMLWLQGYLNNCIYYDYSVVDRSDFMAAEKMLNNLHKYQDYSLNIRLFTEKSWLK